MGQVEKTTIRLTKKQADDVAREVALAVRSLIKLWDASSSMEGIVGQDLEVTQAIESLAVVVDDDFCSLEAREMLEDIFEGMDITLEIEGD
jgi:hypothetical protein